MRRPNGSDDHSVGGELDWWPSVGVRADLDTRDVIPRRRVPWLVDVSLRVSYGTAIRWSPGDVRARFGAGEVERVMPSQREAREWSRGWQENLTAALADGWCPELWREVRS